MRIRHIALALCFWVAALLPATAANPVSSTRYAGRSPDPRGLVLELGMRFHKTKLDCSHFVHALYDRVGLPYHYGTSRSLYGGTRTFHRVIQPEPGDLVAWRGHIGIVVNPVKHSFLSALRSGVKISSYESSYWKLRGHPHFLHYVARGDFGQTQNGSFDEGDAETAR